MKKVTVVLLIIALFLVSCAPATPPAPTVDVAALQTAAVEAAVLSLNQTATAMAPTNTPLPTNTPIPTDTPIPTATSTPKPQPIVLKGDGDSIVDIKKWPDPGLLKATYASGSNFMVTNYGADGKRIDLLINAIGAYSGIVPIDFLKEEQTARLEVKASGPWEIQILTLDAARIFTVPTTITGTGDDVVIIKGTPDLLKIDASKASSNFAIWSYGDSGRDLAVNEIAPYTGTVIVARDTVLLTITATGEWSIDVTSPK